ncbi:DAO [Symbiodinium sp. CCMP2592]|nr:DAO [Symbiodinium sp. CCMP2592]
MAATPMKRVLVVGSGAIGLRTALELSSRKQVHVQLFSPRHPLHPSTCSMGAGGLWMPFHCDDPRTDRWATETLDELLDYTVAKESAEARLVEIVPTVKLMKELIQSTTLGEWTSDPRLKFQQLTVEMLSQQNSVNRLRIPSEHELLNAGYRHAHLFFTPIVNATLMLQHLLERASEMLEEVDVPSAPTDETTGMFESMQEMIEMAATKNCDAVVNCTGLASRKLCHDDQMLGARGILLHYDRETVERRQSFVTGRDSDQANTNDAAIMAEHAPWGSDTLPCYLVPRGPTILVGGSYLEQDARETISDEERVRLFQNSFNLGIDIDKSTPTSQWVGFRPYRPTVRCEIDSSFTHSPIKLIHNYGHGGSGWTVNVGAAKECASLVREALQA